MAVRLTDVAQEAGVSLATASRVLNGSARRPQEEIAQRVRRAAERLGYYPNAQAQALARSTAGLIGLVVHDIADPYFASIARGANAALSGSGKQLMLATTERERGAEIHAVRAFMSYRTDAILLAGSRGYEDDQALEQVLGTYTANGGHVAMIGQPLEGLMGIEIANTASSRALAEELISLGHQRFAILAGEPQLHTSEQRTSGFLQGLRNAGLEPEIVLEGTFTRSGGAELMKRLINQGHTNSEQGRLCVFCANDVMALGALAALREAGLNPPADIALAGFDDIPTLADQYPGITSVRLPLEDIGHQGATMLLDPSEKTQRILIPGQPILRESTSTA